MKIKLFALIILLINLGCDKKNNETCSTGNNLLPIALRYLDYAEYVELASNIAKANDSRLLYQYMNICLDVDGEHAQNFTNGLVLILRKSPAKTFNQAFLKLPNSKQQEIINSICEEYGLSNFYEQGKRKLEKDKHINEFIYIKCLKESEKFNNN